tara:strand:- start:93 stop:368 length:276 start_codon:yes stop_codon:yes gene_type:complete
MIDDNDFKEAFPLDHQEDGDHYKQLPFQPFTYCRTNKFNATQSNIIKYASRLYTKGDPIKQLNKIIHYCQLEKDFLKNDKSNKKTDKNKKA